MIYFLQSVDGGPIKIGTTACLSGRLRQLSKDHDCNLRVLAVLEGSYPEERALHQRFNRLRVVSEWFEPADDLLAFIAEEGREWDGTDERPTGSVKLHIDVIESARVVAALRGVTITNLISDMVEADLYRMEREEIAKRAKAPKEESI